jgi:calcineurin-like phosphoesterase family protein
MKKEDFIKYPKHFVASDIHFNHKNILKYNADARGDGRDFDSLSEAEVTELVVRMNDTIVQRWNEVVGPDDHTFILGDLCMGQMQYAVETITRLNGWKTIVLGNHDRGLMKLPEFQSRESKLEIKVLNTVHYLCWSPRKKVEIVMSHFPFASWDGMGKGSMMLHGHLHGAEVQVIDAANKRIMDVGIDTNGLYPYNLEEVIQRMHAKPLPKHDHHMKEL